MDMAFRSGLADLGPELVVQSGMIFNGITFSDDHRRLGLTWSVSGHEFCLGLPDDVPNRLNDTGNGLPFLNNCSSMVLVQSAVAACVGPSSLCVRGSWSGFE